MNSEDRNLELLTCKNVMNVMADAMQDVLMVYDDVVEDVLDSRYRIAISALEAARERLSVRKKRRGYDNDN